MTNQEILDYLNQYRNAGNHIHREAMDAAIEAFEKQIKQMPTVDIVRCRECKHRREYEEYDKEIDEFVDCSYCKRDGKSHDEDWFCGDGERKNDND